MWQPIETAPKDGAEILACYVKDWGWQDSRSVYGPWTISFRRGKWMASWDEGPVIESESYAGTQYANPPVDPTHWMPLPKPPQ